MIGFLVYSRAFSFMFTVYVCYVIMFSSSDRKKKANIYIMNIENLFMLFFINWPLSKLNFLKENVLNESIYYWFSSFKSLQVLRKILVILGIYLTNNSRLSSLNPSSVLFSGIYTNQRLYLARGTIERMHASVQHLRYIFAQIKNAKFYYDAKKMKKKIIKGCAYIRFSLYIVENRKLVHI